MRKTKLDDKSKFMYALIIAVLLVALAFLFGYKKLENSATALNADNAALETRIASLKQYFDTEAQNLEDTQTMTTGINEILSGYAGDARYEDAMYEAYYLYGASSNTLEYDSVGFASPVAVKEIPAETVMAAQIEGLEDRIVFYQFDVDYSGKVLYEGLKGVIDQMIDGKYDIAIAEMNYQINDDGYIEGDTLTSFYYVDGAGCEYTAPAYTAYETGISNLFGVSGSADEEEED